MKYWCPDACVFVDVVVKAYGRSCLTDFISQLYNEREKYEMLFSENLEVNCLWIYSLIMKHS